MLPQTLLPQPTYANGVGSQILASTEVIPHMLGIPVPYGDDPIYPPQPAVAAEAASPIRSRPPPPTSFDDELLPGGFPDEEDAESGGAPGNRWPRQETLALFKIRSEMDAAFREATFKGPLWEEVSRKLAALGCKRSAKKCKEKFENVHKYYKRTKEARADGKTYRFFSQMEALHSSSGGGPTAAAAAAVAPPTAIAFTNATVGPPAATIQALPLFVMAPSANAIPSTVVAWSASSSPSESNDEGGAEERGVNGEGRKRKRRRAGQWMMTFFEGLMKQVMERQEEMQRWILEAIEQREEDRMIREEAWRRQELSLHSREQELLAQESAKAAARDAAIISYLQKIGSDKTTPQSPAIPTIVAVSVAPLHPLVPSQLPPPPQPPHLQSTPPKQEPEGHVNGSLESPPSLRWPKAEVHALIKLRSGLEARYQVTGPKGQLWEEITAGMRQMGYNRSSKRCKEKWENINKYFKKVKDGRKPRAEDEKTCPYFHQLDALYRERLLGTVPAAAVKPIQAEEKEKVSSNNIGDGWADSVQITSNGDHQPIFSEEGAKKPEEALQDLDEEMQPQKETMNDHDCEKMAEPDSNTLDQLDEEDEEEENEEGSNTQYKIQFQQLKVNGGGEENASTAAAAASVDIAVSTAHAKIRRSSPDSS